MPFGKTYKYSSQRDNLQILTRTAESIKRLLPPEGIINTVKNNLGILQTEADDLITTFNYADAETADERVTSIVYSSVALGLTVTKTFNYGGSSGTYYVTSTTLS